MKKRIVKFFVTLFIKCLFKIIAIGVENIPHCGACIAVSNHLGRIDGFLAYVVVPRKDVIIQIARKYQKIPIFRFLRRLGDGLWLDQKKLDIGAYREIEKRLNAGGILCITPEGTRSKTGELLKGKPGASYFAIKHQLPVIPEAIIGSEDNKIILRLKKFRRPEITVIFGKPFTLKPEGEKKRKEILEECTVEIMCRIATLLPENYRGFYSNHPRLIEIESDDNE